MRPLASLAVNTGSFPNLNARSLTHQLCHNTHEQKTSFQLYCCFTGTFFLMNFSNTIPGLLLCWAATLIAFASAQFDVNLDCDPCIDRSSYKIQAIYHGITSSTFWDQIEAPAVQAANDLGVVLEVTRFESYSPDIMAAAVRGIINAPNRPDALVVSIPSEIVAAAVQDVINAGIPVFGLNSGYKLARQLGVLAWVAQDEEIAGEQAAATFLATVPNIPPTARIAFLNSQPGNSGFADRLAGFNEFVPLVNRGLSAEELNLDPSQPEAPQLETLVGSCTYDFVLLASSGRLAATLSVLAANGCDTRVGSFDESNVLFDGIRSGTVSFGMSQQKYLQGMLPIIFAATYVTTGKVPAVPSRNPNGMYLSNGAPWTSSRLPSAERQQCLEDSFPVCPTVGENGCPCFDRSSIRIGGVVHGDTADTFWDNVFAGAAVAAKDMGVELDMPRFDPSVDNAALVMRMNEELARLCTGSNPVDGLFVSIPNDGVVAGIRQCQDAGIPIIAVNSGALQTENLGLQHFVGQLEFAAGFQAAEELLEAGMVRGYCLNHAPGIQTLTQRCEGFRAAFGTVPGAEYVAEIDVDTSNPLAYRSSVEAIVQDNLGTWIGKGFLLTGSIQAAGGLELLAVHPDALVGTFDTGRVIFDALESSQFLFGINQQPYFQGYLPIPLLTVRIQANRQLLNVFVESGPKFVSTPPPEGDQVCMDNEFQVCDATPTVPSPLPVPAPSPPSSNGQCVGYNQACIFSSDCCSDRCVFNTCKIQVRINKTKLGGESRGGQAGGAGSRGGNRRVRGMNHD